MELYNTENASPKIMNAFDLELEKGIRQGIEQGLEHGIEFLKKGYHDEINFKKHATRNDCSDY